MHSWPSRASKPGAALGAEGTSSPHARELHCPGPLPQPMPHMKMLVRPLGPSWRDLALVTVPGTRVLRVKTQGWTFPVGGKGATSGPSALGAVLGKGLGHGQAAEHPSPERPWASLCRGEEGFEQSAPLVPHIRDASLDHIDHIAVPPPKPGVLLSPQSGRGGTEFPTSKQKGTRRAQGQQEGW